jgi:hypothetical protein
MLGKIVLWFTAAMFIVYGVVCFFSPELPANYAGLVIASGDGYAEVGAMYGGLQLGFGLFCALAALRKEYYRAGLLLLVLGIGLLALGRFYSMLTGDNSVGPYTYGALIYESLTAMLAALALWRTKAS